MGKLFLGELLGVAERAHRPSEGPNRGQKTRGHSEVEIDHCGDDGIRQIE